MQRDFQKPLEQWVFVRISLKKAKRKFWNTQFILPTLSKINQKQNKIDFSI
jgi:hypothetical protein